MGGLGNVVLNAVGRTLTREAVGRAIKIPKSSCGKKMRIGPKKGSAKGKKGAR